MTQVNLRGAGTSQFRSPDTALTSYVPSGMTFAGVETAALLNDLSALGAGVEGDAAAAAALLKSKAVPGVFGVLVAEPNDAKAPEPRPKAVEAPEVGEDMLAVARGGMALKGLDLPPCEELPLPKRLALEKSRVGCSVLFSLWSVLFIDRESLEVLKARSASGSQDVRQSVDWAAGGGRAHFERRVQRFSLSLSIEAELQLERKDGGSARAGCGGRRGCGVWVEVVELGSER